MENNATYNLLMAVGLVILLIVSFANLYEEDNTVTVPTAEEIAELIVVPTVVVQNSSDVKLDQVLEKVLEDETWENDAEALATAEWTERDYKDLFKAIEDIYGDLDDEDDIDYVKEDESTKFKNMDADDGDGKVVQYLKVKYEDKDGDNKKVYLTVKTVFDEFDLDDQKISQTV